MGNLENPNHVTRPLKKFMNQVQIVVSVNNMVDGSWAGKRRAKPGHPVRTRSDESSINWVKRVILGGAGD